MIWPLFGCVLPYPLGRRVKNSPDAWSLCKDDNSRRYVFIKKNGVAIRLHAYRMKAQLKSRDTLSMSSFSCILPDFHSDLFRIIVQQSRVLFIIVPHPTSPHVNRLYLTPVNSLNFTFTWLLPYLSITHLALDPLWLSQFVLPSLDAVSYSNYSGFI